MIRKNSVVKIQNLVVYHESRPVKLNPVYFHVHQIIKNRGSGTYNRGTLRHADNRKHFSGLSLTRTQREAHMFHLAREMGKIWRCSC